MNKWKLETTIKYDFERVKREKIKEAIEKGYSLEPEKHSFQFLIKRLRQEVDELEESIKYEKPESAVKECADISNILDFIYKKLWNYNSCNKTEKEKKQ